MKKLYSLIFFILILYIGQPVSFSQENVETDDSFINSFEEDITGDGFREYFKLQGALLSNKSNYYRSVWLNITSPFQKYWKISLSGGYEPTIQLIDFNHDHIFDLFYKVARDENKLQYHHQLYTLRNGEVKQISLPVHKYLAGEFKDAFIINIRLHPNDKPITIDVSKKKEQYIDKQFYRKDGELLQKKGVAILPISSMEPVLISESKGYGLQTIQSIGGMNEDDLLGTIETLWYFKDEQWIVLRSKWTEQL